MIRWDYCIGKGEHSTSLAHLGMSSSAGFDYMVPSSSVLARKRRAGNRRLVFFSLVCLSSFIFFFLGCKISSFFASGIGVASSVRIFVLFSFWKEQSTYLISRLEPELVLDNFHEQYKFSVFTSNSSILYYLNECISSHFINVTAIMASLIPLHLSILSPNSCCRMQLVHF